MVFQIKGPALIILILVCQALRSDAVYKYGEIGCKQSLKQLVIPKSEDEVEVLCPSSCLRSRCIVTGSNPYLPTSRICCAAIHSGALDEETGGKVHLTINYGGIDGVRGSEANGVQSDGYRITSYNTFIIEKMTQISPNTTEQIKIQPKPNTQISQSKPEQSKSQESNIETSNEQSNTQEDENTHEEQSKNIIPVANEITKVEESLAPQLTAKPRRPSTESSKILEEVENNLRIENEHIEEIIDDIRSSSASRSHRTEPATTSSATHKELPKCDKSIGWSDVPSRIAVLLILIGFLTGASVPMICILCKITRNHGSFRIKIPIKARKLPSTFHSSRTEDPDVCICYNNLNTSRQGLLTDPETCDRPCPIRQTFNPEENSVMLGEELMKRDLKSLKRDFRSEDNCASGCDGHCQPQLYEF